MRLPKAMPREVVKQKRVASKPLHGRTSAIAMLWELSVTVSSIAVEVDLLSPYGARVTINNIFCGLGSDVSSHAGLWAPPAIHRPRHWQDLRQRSQKSSSEESLMFHKWHLAFLNIR